MNSSIRNLFVLFVLLFGVLVLFTSRWTVFEDGDLRADSLNRRDVIRARALGDRRRAAVDHRVEDRPGVLVSGRVAFEDLAAEAPAKVGRVHAHSPRSKSSRP